MSKTFLNVVGLSIFASLGLPAAAAAEALPRGTLPLAITPALIQEAANGTQLTPAACSSTVLRMTNQRDELVYVSPRVNERIPNGCANNPGALCYDYQTGNTIYKPMRSLLPELPGMTPHNLSIRRNKIVAQYSFK